MAIAFTHKYVVEGAAFVLLGLIVFGTSLPKAWRTLNTDFPNYYLTARLAHEGVDTARAYDWVWIEREKDHRGLDQRVVGLVPITPFSTLLTWPLSRFDALTAKRLWILFNLALLVATIFLLARLSGLTVFEAGILCELSYPLQINFLYGQYYVLLLFLLAAGCWAAQQKRPKTAGALVGFAAGLKIFPILLTLYFIRRKDWRALTVCALTIAATIGISLAVFGAPMHRTYLQQVLPWTLRGDALPAFNLHSGSYSTVLHRLFLYEPQWNPHPAARARWLFAVLLPLLQFVLLAPVVIFMRGDAEATEGAGLEWSALVLIALTISTSPGSYLFMLLILPMAVMGRHLFLERRYASLGATLVLFLVASSPWQPRILDGWGTLLGIPRLYALLALTGISTYLLRRQRALDSPGTGRWLVGTLAVATLFSIASGLRHQRGQSDDFAYRLPLDEKILLAAHPAVLGDNIVFSALGWEGYRATSISPLPDAELPAPSNANMDQLTLAVNGNRVWTEGVLGTSVLHSPSRPGIENAESPAFSLDGIALAFLRQVNGRKQLFVQTSGEGTRQLTAAPANVQSAAFLPDHTLIVAATLGAAPLALYHLDSDRALVPLDVGEARDPAISRDGQWLAYSRFVEGNWNLFLRDLQSGATTRVTDAPCNQVEPAWKADSKTLIYATDCGRSLWFTAIAQRRVLP